MVIPFCLDGLKKINIDLGYSTNIGWSLFSVLEASSSNSSLWKLCSAYLR